MADGCDSFTQHAWKQDLCANCLKPRDKHTTVPVPAKRPVKPARPASRAPSTAETAPVLEAPDWNGTEMENGTGEKQKSKGEPRFKPTIAAKPDGLRQGSPETEGQGRGRAKPPISAVKPTISTKSSVKVQRSNTEPRSSALGKDGRNETAVVEDDGIYGAPSTGEGITQLPPDGAYDTVPKPVAVQEGEQQHYYSKYDVAFKGLSGSPTPVGGHARNRSLDRLKYDIEIVMPYTVVDISTDPPGLDPDGGPPRMPSSSPPDKENSTNGKSRSASPLARGSPSASPLSRRKDGGSPTQRHIMRILDSAESAELEGVQSGRASPGKPVILHGEKDRMKTRPFRSPTTNRKVALFIAPGGTDNGVYEDVADPDSIPEDSARPTNQDTKEAEGKFTRNVPVRTSSQKSAVFEAKLSTIAQSLEFHKQKGGGKSTEPSAVPAPTEAPGPTEPELIQVPISKKDKKKAAQAAKEEAKPEKARKGSVGKSFFRKLFGRGSGGGDNEETATGSTEGAVEPDTVSVGSEEGQGNSKCSSLSASVENSPRLPRGRMGSDTDEKLGQVARNLSRGESIRESALFSVELKQALARNSSIGEKDIAGAIAKYREGKREGSVGAEVNRPEGKSAPPVKPGVDKKPVRTDDQKNDAGEKPNLRQTKKATSETLPQKTGPDVDKVDFSSKGDPKPEHSTFGKERKSMEVSAKDVVPGKDRHTISIEGPSLKGSTSPVKRTSITESGADDTSRIPGTNKADVSAKPEVKAKPEKSRRPPPVPPPMPPPANQTNRRSSCTSPVSPRPNVPPPPSPKYPDPSTNTASKTSPAEDPVIPRENAPLSPTKGDKKEAGKGDFSEIYGKRPEISAPRLDRTSAIFEVNVGMIEAGAGSTSPPFGSPRDPPETATFHTTMTLDRRPRPKSELQTSEC